ncbi:hypothetical protein D3C87_706890 [compost metagenome]
MKIFKLLLTACFFYCIQVNAQKSYYIAANGDDNATGLTAGQAWTSLEKINKTKFEKGDKIFFRSGDVFKGQLRISSTDLSIDAYGKGNKPVISGEEHVKTKWTVKNGKIWETQLSGAKITNLTNLFKNGAKQPISRYPNLDVNNGYLNFETHEGVTKFIDNELTDGVNWTGAEMNVRVELWRMLRIKVVSHKGNAIEFAPNKEVIRLRDGFGYFFVNDIKAIDLEGEWAYDAATEKIYLYSTTDPNLATISYPKFEKSISILNSENVSLKNIKVFSAARLGIEVAKSSNIVLDGVEVVQSGGDGITFNNTQNSVLQNSLVSDMNWSGVYSAKSANHIKFINNTVKNIGNSAFGKSKTYVGIDCNSSFSEIVGNTIKNTGYAGIIACGENNLVKRNIVDSVCRILEDMGGIYTNNNINNTTGTIIEDNIVTNSSVIKGGGVGQHSLCNGIYLDNRSQGVTVRNNTVGFVDGCGIFLHATLKNNKVYDNTSFQSGYNEFQITNPDTIPEYDIQRNILVTNNPSKDHVVMLVHNTKKFTIPEIGTFKGNYVVNPFQSNNVKINYKTTEKVELKRVSVADWEKIAGEYATGNQVSQLNYTPAQAQNIVFLYNSTSKAKKYILNSGKYLDVKNKVYQNSATIEPFKSVVLFKQN